MDGVPVLHVSQNNEARRLITLLDGLYEARCKLIIQAEAGPDDLFFPEMKATSSTRETAGDNNGGGDAVYPKTLSKVYQDQTSPFRPNISFYKNEPKSGYDPDEDSDFGPISGKDERFAYKRASSRLLEMCGSRWHARDGQNWWRPLLQDVRRLGRSSSSTGSSSTLERPSSTSDVKIGESIELDKPAGLQGKLMEEREQTIKSPFREEREAPTKIGWTHAWDMVKFGNKAGPWGQGPEGLGSKSKE
ncbi:hypothetical protein G7Y89_g1855 [Cudoniella acicularis]|uniref:Uncharacterized protein n=1 Tax=Cudoniella acicularis TaxID=354080 RepID=A0A8H4RXE7_9HELO|nr:hypothetical protein G7Y89_g1855 [Cudoniella acicularis]